MDKKNKPSKAIDNFHQNKKDIPSDVLGSYTGTDEDFEAPVQDADDL